MTSMRLDHNTTVKLSLYETFTQFEVPPGFFFIFLELQASLWWATLCGLVCVIFRPPVRSNGRTYKMLVMFLFRLPVRSNGRSSVLPVMFFFLFFSPRVLPVPSTDRPETLPPDGNLRVFYNAIPKIRGALPQKIRGPKRCKISVDFGPLQTLIVNISGKSQHIKNRKTLQTMAIPPAFDEKSPVNFGPL